MDKEKLLTDLKKRDSDQRARRQARGPSFRPTSN
jgi:hypothetical protein